MGRSRGRRAGERSRFRALPRSSALGGVLMSTSPGTPAQEGPSSLDGAENVSPGFAEGFASLVPGEGFELREGYAEIGDQRLHYVEVGEGPLVVLLHGFPEFWFGWRSQIPALVGAGFRVVAPDMRGYNLSSRPSGWRSYDSDHLAADIAGLVRHFGAEKAHVVGHDWGAAVAYYTAMQHPEVVDRLVIMNVPHPER